jgi:hypothetical protein|tara:strand:- start:851 stop:1069 length:219 start_codon:yes stop_codon:yes gene_type:complete
MSKAKPKDEKPEVYKFTFYASKNPWHEQNGNKITHKDILSAVTEVLSYCDKIIELDVVQMNLCEIVETKKIK